MFLCGNLHHVSSCSLRFIPVCGILRKGHIRGETIVVDGGAWLWKPPSLPREMVAESSRSIEKKSRAVVGKAKL